MKLLRVLPALALLTACNNAGGRNGEDKVSGDSTASAETSVSLADSVRKYPDSLGLRVRYVQQLNQQEKFPDALQELNALLKKDSTNAALWFQQGAVLARSGDTVRSIPSLERSLRLAPLFAQPQIELAAIYSARSDPRALTYADRLIRSSEDPAILTQARFIKGLYYSNRNQLEAALRAFDECIQNDYTFLDAYIEKGLILFDQKKYPAALQVYQKAITVSNRFIEAYYQSGRCHEAIGNKEEAIAAYEKAISLDPTFEEAKERRKNLSN